MHFYKTECKDCTHLGYFSFWCTDTSPINPLWGFVFSVVFYIFGISIKAALKTLSKEDAQNSYCPPELQNLNFSLHLKKAKTNFYPCRKCMFPPCLTTFHMDTCVRFFDILQLSSFLLPPPQAHFKPRIRALPALNGHFLGNDGCQNGLYPLLLISSRQPTAAICLRSNENITTKTSQRFLPFSPFTKTL